MHKFLKPGLFKIIIKRSIYPISIISLVSLIMGLYMIFWKVPDDYVQGPFVKIMYIHVPSAWMAMLCYCIMGFASCGFLVWRSPVSNIIAKSTAPIGASFAFITLVTGSIWGKPTWGAWWVWDARLTSMLILFLFYLGYLSLIDVFKRNTNSVAPAILSIFGLINIPIVKFSVNYWNSLHQPASILRKNGPSIHPDMLWPLFIMFIFCFSFYLIVLFIKIKTDFIQQKSKRRPFLYH